MDDLENIDVELEDEDKVILLLNTLPKSFEHMKDVMLFGRENLITLDEVELVLGAKELQKLNEGKQELIVEGLNIKKFIGNKSKKSNADGKKENHAKIKESEGRETCKCHHCMKPSHLKNDCFIWKKKQAHKNQVNNPNESG